MYNLQVSLRQSAYGGVRAVLVVPRDVVTTGPAPGIAHGIGASALPRGTGMALPLKEALRSVDGPPPPRPVTGPQPSVPAPAPAPRSAPKVMAALEDDVPVVTEWTENGLPQRRSRTRAPLGSHNLGLVARNAAAASAPPAAETNGTHGGANGTNGGDGQGRRPGPGIWLEAFTKAVNGTPQEPSHDEGQQPGSAAWARRFR